MCVGVYDLWGGVVLPCTIPHHCRLRHVRTRETPQERGGYAAHYRSLRCYDINDLPPSPPTPILDGSKS